MNTNSMTNNDIQNAFTNLLQHENEQEKWAQKGQILAFKFLSEVDEAMEKQGMKKKELARKVGTSASFITQLFMGDRKPNWELLARMAEALDLDFYVTTKEKHLTQYYSPRADKDGLWVYKKRGNTTESDYNYEPNPEFNALAV
jgi:ribosome-binding protein aMBF1 (putative translation factor)